MRGPPAWATLAAASAQMAAPSWRMASPVPCIFGKEQVLPSSQLHAPLRCRIVPKETLCDRPLTYEILHKHPRNGRACMEAGCSEGSTSYQDQPMLHH